MNTYSIDNVKMSFPDDINEMRDTFRYLLADEQKKIISFINPEIFMKQKSDDNLHSYFETSKYNFIDGIGLLYAINHKFHSKLDSNSRYPGTDFFDYLPPDNQIKLFLYGSKLENVTKAKKLIEEKYSNVRVSDFCDGYSSESDDTLIAKINNSNADILIVCLGCPKQELWLQKNFEKLNPKIMFGNGGAIDFWSENVKRAPDFFIRHGLEFIYRLFQNFTFARIKRQLKLVKFFFSYKNNKYIIEKIS